MLILLRVLNFINGGLLVWGCYQAFQILGDGGGVITRSFLALYLGLFGLLLVIFELRVGFVESFIKKRFGFMFNHTGRLMYLIFVGAIGFGILDDSNKDTSGRSWVTGICVTTLANAVVNMVIMCFHPAFIKQANEGP